MNKDVVEEELSRLPLDDLISLLQERMALQTIVSKGMAWPSGTVKKNSRKAASLNRSREDEGSV